MIITIEQDKILRKYTERIGDESYKLKDLHIPHDAKEVLLDIDESNMILYGKHLITNIKQMR